tara:strand:- start:1048 stop:1452 length:405 start_codon:yes stop_codon:yes gene_type:complete
MNESAVKVKAEVMWAYLNKPNEMSGKYQVDLCNLSDKAVGALEEMGIEVKTKEGKGKYITCKSQRPIAAYDDGGTLIEGDILGNGSKAAAVITPYAWSFKGKKGVSPSLRKMVVTELVAFSGGGGSDFAEEDLL